MKITNYFNTSEQEIKDKKFNILIGISLGNKYFTESVIKESIVWALENTKGKVVVLIPDKLHAINYEIRNGYSKERAEKISFRKGEQVKKIIENILEQISPNKRDLIDILKWQSIETTKYKSMTTAIWEEFEKNQEFKSIIIEIMKENIKFDRLKDNDYVRLSAYVLNELPLLISGIEYNGLSYNIHPYPRLGKIEDLVVDLQDGRNFPELTKKLSED